MKRPLVILALAFALTLAAVGCAKFPYGASFDRHNFVSTPARPVTVILEDALTREELVRIDVPVGKKLVMDFDHKTDWAAGPSSALPAEEVRWQVLPPDKTFSGTLRNQMRLSGNPVRMRQEIRAPQSMTEAREPDYQPAEGPAGGDGEGGPLPRYQPSEPRGGNGGAAPEADQRGAGEGEADRGDKIAPQRGPATREPVDEPANAPAPDQGDGEDNADQSETPRDGEEDADASAPGAAELEEALEAGRSQQDGSAGPRYVPSEDHEQGDEAGGETDGDTPLGASG